MPLDHPRGSRPFGASRGDSNHVPQNFEARTPMYTNTEKLQYFEILTRFLHLQPIKRMFILSHFHISIRNVIIKHEIRVFCNIIRYISG